MKHWIGARIGYKCQRRIGSDYGHKVGVVDVEGLCLHAIEGESRRDEVL